MLYCDLIAHFFVYLCRFVICLFVCLFFIARVTLPENYMYSDDGCIFSFAILTFSQIYLNRGSSLT